MTTLKIWDGTAWQTTSGQGANGQGGTGGGATSSVLIKNSAGDYDTKWGTQPGNMGYVELTTPQTGFITTPSDVAGSLFQFNAVANRKYQIQAAIQVQKITTAGYVVAQVTDNSNNAIVAVAADVGVNGFATMSLFRQSTFTAGQVTLKLRLFCSAGTVNTAANQPVVVFCVNDVGP